MKLMSILPSSLREAAFRWGLQETISQKPIQQTRYLCMGKK
jgi:hypothetical protein